MICWLLATLFLAVKLKAQPPNYFPKAWKEAANANNQTGDASQETPSK
jgi:hypothetical protein